LRGFAILSVVLTHACAAGVFEGIPVLQNGVITSVLCQGGMSAFLILSGYGLHQSWVKKGLEDFWNRRFDKILFPLIVINFICSLLKRVNIPHGVDLSADGTMWYLYYLFFCYISFYVSFKYIHTPPENKNSKVIVFIIFQIVSMPYVYIRWQFASYCTFSFLLGVIVSCFAIKHRIILSIYHEALFIALTFASSLFYCYYFVHHKSNFILIDNICSNILGLSFYLLIKCFKLYRFKIIVFIGHVSFFIYLLEWKILYSFFDYKLYPSPVRLIVFFLLFIMTLLLAYAMEKVIKIIIGGYLPKETM